MRWSLWPMFFLAFGAYGVGQAHDVPPALAAVLAGVCAVTALVLSVAWPPHASRGFTLMAMALVVVSLWPAVVWPAWLFFGLFLGALVVLGLWVGASTYRSAVRTDRLVDTLSPQARETFTSLMHPGNRHGANHIRKGAR